MDENPYQSPGTSSNRKAISRRDWFVLIQNIRSVGLVVFGLLFAGIFFLAALGMLALAITVAVEKL